MPITVMMSGGIDSEIVARSFLSKKIPFTATIFSYLPNRSRDDIPWAIDFCKANGIKYEVIPFDIIQFFRVEAPDYFKRYKMHEPFAAVDIKRMELVDSYPVFGNGDVYIEYKKETRNFYSVELGSYALPWVWQQEHSHPACWRFFKFTPEIQASFLLDPLTQHWLDNAPKMNWDNNRLWKIFFAKHHWPEMPIREKLTGYERLAGDYLELQEDLKKIYSYKRDKHYIPINQLIKDLNPCEL